MLDTLNALLFSALVYVIASSGPTGVSWDTTKRHIRYDTLSLSNPATLYGGCRILPNWSVDLTSCHYWFREKFKQKGTKTENPSRVLGKIDMEHIVTVERMRKYSGCGDLNRVQCRRSNKKFKACHNNVLNIYPVVSTINRHRGSLPFKELKPKESIYPFGKFIDFKKSIDGKAVEPPERSKFAVATAYFAMEKADCIRLTDEETITFSSWMLQN